MKTLMWFVIIIVILVGGFYWWTTMQNQNVAVQTPAGTAGINGSSNQGNLGQPASGTPQQLGDGTSVSQNLALGVTSNATLGKYLTAYNGMTVYTYKKDSAGKSTCTGTCAQNWPPYTVPAGTTLNLQSDISGLVSTITRADGTSQVTYNSMPLYFYIGDKTSSDATGEGMGKVWYVVKP